MYIKHPASEFEKPYEKLATIDRIHLPVEFSLMSSFTKCLKVFRAGKMMIFIFSLLVCLTLYRRPKEKLDTFCEHLLTFFELERTWKLFSE